MPRPSVPSVSTGDIVYDLPPDAKIVSDFPPGTVLTPIISAMSSPYQPTPLPIVREDSPPKPTMKNPPPFIPSDPQLGARDSKTSKLGRPGQAQQSVFGGYSLSSRTPRLGNAAMPRPATTPTPEPVIPMAAPQPQHGRMQVPRPPAPTSSSSASPLWANMHAMHGMAPESPYQPPMPMAMPLGPPLSPRPQAFVPNPGILSPRPLRDNPPGTPFLPPPISRDPTPTPTPDPISREPSPMPQVRRPAATTSIPGFIPDVNNIQRRMPRPIAERARGIGALTPRTAAAPLSTPRIVVPENAIEDDDDDESEYRAIHTRPRANSGNAKKAENVKSILKKTGHGQGAGSGNYAFAPPQPSYDPPTMTPRMMPIAPGGFPGQPMTPWMNAPDDFRPPQHFRENAAAMATPKSTHSNLDFASPRSIWNPPPFGAATPHSSYNYLGGATPGAQPGMLPGMTPRTRAMAVINERNEREGFGLTSPVDDPTPFLPPGAFRGDPSKALPRRPHSRASNGSSRSNGWPQERYNDPTSMMASPRHAFHPGLGPGMNRNDQIPVPKTPGSRSVRVEDVTDEEDGNPVFRPAMEEPRSSRLPPAPPPMTRLQEKAAQKQAAADEKASKKAGGATTKPKKKKK